MFRNIAKRVFQKMYRIGYHEDLKLRKRERDDFLQKMVTFDASAVIAEEASIENNQLDKSKIVVGKESRIMGSLCVFTYGGKITIGEHCFLGPESRIWSGEEITIGNNVLISHQVNVYDFAHELGARDRAEGFKNLSKFGHPEQKGKIPTNRIIIEDDVIIYAGVHIMMGIKIGAGSIISAGSVVTRDVPPFSLVLGNPGKVIWKTKP